jgi:MFS family permease
VIVGGFLLFNTIPEPKPKSPPLEIIGSAVKSLDLLGFMLICPAVVMLLLGLQFGGNEHPWDSSVVIGLLVGAAATFAAFLAWEYRQGDQAMVPLAMLKHRVIWSAAMTMFFSLSSVLVADFYIAIYFQAIRDDSPLMSGVHMLPITLGLVLFTIVSGVLSKCGRFFYPFTLLLMILVLSQSRFWDTISRFSLQGVQSLLLATGSCRHSAQQHLWPNGSDTRFFTELRADAWQQQ